MKYQNLFSGRNKKHIFKVSSAEYGHRVVKVKVSVENSLLIATVCLSIFCLHNRKVNQNYHGIYLIDFPPWFTRYTNFILSSSLLFCKPVPFLKEVQERIDPGWFLRGSLWSNYRTYSAYSERQGWANSVDTDQTPHKAASDQDLHCLPLTQQILYTFIGSKLDLMKQSIR